MRGNRYVAAALPNWSCSQRELEQPWLDLAEAYSAARAWCPEIDGRLHSETAAVPLERLQTERDVTPPVASATAAIARRRDPHGRSPGYGALRVRAVRGARTAGGGGRRDRRASAPGGHIRHAGVGITMTLPGINCQVSPTTGLSLGSNVVSGGTAQRSSGTAYELRSAPVRGKGRLPATLGHSRGAHTDLGSISAA